MDRTGTEPATSIEQRHRDQNQFHEEEPGFGKRDESPGHGPPLEPFSFQPRNLYQHDENGTGRIPPHALELEILHLEIMALLLVPSRARASSPGRAPVA